MAAQDLLRNKVDETPTIYAYTLPDVPKYKGLLKVGYTSRPGTIRIKEQGHELYLDKEILLRKSSMRPDGTYFTDKGLGGVHYYLHKNRIPNPFGEWFRCDVKDVERAIHAAMERPVPLKAICSQKWASPCCCGVSCREPARTAMPQYAT